MLEMEHAKVYPCNEFEVSSFIRSTFTERALKIDPGPWPFPLLSYFVTHEMGLAKINPYTKFEVSSFTRSRFIEGGLKFLASLVSNLRKGFKI